VAVSALIDGNEYSDRSVVVVAPSSDVKRMQTSVVVPVTASTAELSTARSIDQALSRNGENEAEEASRRVATALSALSTPGVTAFVDPLLVESGRGAGADLRAVGRAGGLQQRRQSALGRLRQCLLCAVGHLRGPRARRPPAGQPRPPPAPRPARKPTGVPKNSTGSRSTPDVVGRSQSGIGKTPEDRHESRRIKAGDLVSFVYRLVT